MNKRNNYNSDDLEELLWRAEQVLAEPEEDEYEDPYFEDDPDDDSIVLDDFDPEDEEEDDSVLFQNYANNYGAGNRSHASGYREPTPRAMNSRRYMEEYEEPPELPVRRRPPVREPQPVPQRPPRRKRGCGCGCFGFLLLLIAAIVAAAFLLLQPPKSDEPIGTRKENTASILICGTDEDGTRTDTMMLMYISGSEKRVRLMSLPRDTYTITASGKAAKLNSAFGRNGTGEEGMEVLMDYVRDIIGYRPDGYILVDFTLVPQIVDIMGGVKFDVPMDMDVASVAIKEGYQKLNGKQLMTLLRFRKGYATADLGRVEMQRAVLKAAMEQWMSPMHIGDALEAMKLLESKSTSSLSMSNYLWIAKTLLTSMKDFGNDTLPGYPEYRHDVSYYVLKPSEVAELVNSTYNPYKVTITEDDLDIAE
ncbi:MAG: LCP family protein [Oscillospiraceae bacterium]|nr:LCP family protein [Oscillospiraceae bacterium]